MLKEYIEDMSDYDIPDFETEANDEALVLEDDDWEDLIRQTKEDRNEAINDASLQFYICNLVHFSWLFVSPSMSTESRPLTLTNFFIYFSSCSDNLRDWSKTFHNCI